MIHIIADQDSSKIIRAEYTNVGYSKTVDVKILTVTKDNDHKNSGTIIEKYRSMVSDAEKYFEENKSTLENFFTKYEITFDNFFPDSVICIFPSDKNRKNLLTAFKNKIIETYQCDIIDDSDKFVKKDHCKSIKKDNLTKEDFTLSIVRQTPIKGLLIIDDVIDEGKTLNILLDKLIDQKLIDSETVLKMTCIYNRPKQVKPKIDIMQAYRDEITNDKESPATNKQY